MLVIALCRTCFFSAKINKKLWPPYFKCSGAGTAWCYLTVTEIDPVNWSWCNIASKSIF